MGCKGSRVQISALRPIPTIGPKDPMVHSVVHLGPRSRPNTGRPALSVALAQALSLRRLAVRGQQLARTATDSRCPRQPASEIGCDIQTVSVTSFSSLLEDGRHAKPCPVSMARVRELPGRLRRQSATDNATGRVAAGRTQPLRKQERTGRTFARAFEDGRSTKRCDREVSRRNLQLQPAPPRHMLASRRRCELVGIAHESAASFRDASLVASARTYNAS
jgi:hypothetical protein